ncbi:MAG: amino acid permease [Chitinophagales bacterium]|jgi:APA family basic amino acid/polyamine antiporter|nr:amino acid permease [Bacteroidota bacterium]MBK7569834.1 amino acid permease [Bacteroidota bacterium]MBP8915584.1 amino acid permease [Chitinophagales bacterium]MBP9219964.1 amino acid permease [Chitinophagales bacterium]MBP9794559.1 amino acid permease [Chitinophagales bacterium]
MSIQPKLKQFDLTMIVVSLVIGVGIFRTPALVAEKSGNELIFFAVWIFGGIISICGALTFAEIGARLPAAGGYYKIFSYAYHPAFAFMLNWSQVIINAGSSAGVAIIGAEYITPVLFPEAADPGLIIKIIAVSIITLLFAINYAGIKMGARTQNVLSVLKIVMILVFCFAIFGKHAEETTISKSIGEINYIQAFGISLISIFFTYGGYQQTVNFGADVENAKRNIPRAIFTGIGIVIFLYLLLNFAYVKVLGFEQMQNSPLIAKDLAQAFLGPVGGTIISVVLFTSVLGFLNTSVMSNPRVYYAMAEDKILPPIFKKVNTKTQVQEFGLTFFISVMIASVFLLGSFENIVNYVLFIDSISLASAAAAIFILRRKSEKDYSDFKMKLYPIVPLLFIVTLLFVTYNTILDDSTTALYGFLIFIGGLPLYYLMRKVIIK